MKKLLQVGVALGVAMTAVPASATEFVFDMRTDGIGTPAAVNGNHFFYQVVKGNEVLNVMVTGWSRQLDGSIKQARVASFDPNGLGIYQQSETTEGAFHQIDNVNGWEFLTLQFSKAVTLSSGVLNSYALAQLDGNGVPVRNSSNQIVYRSYIDNDAFLGWGTSNSPWNVDLGLNNYNQAQVFGALAGKTNTSSDGTAAQTFNLSGVTGNTWMIGGSIGGPDGLNDAFKLAGLTVNTVAAVPEPATWAMMLVGFGMVAGAARYRRRKTTAVFA